MSLHFHWFLPTNGDGRDIVGGGHGVATGSAGAIRPASLSYLGQIARSAEQLGFEAALTPTGAWCEDAWLATSMLAEVTERLKFLVAFRPGLTSPLLAAQMAATFQRYSRGRVLLNVVTGGESAEQRAYGGSLGNLEISPNLWAGVGLVRGGAGTALVGSHAEVADRIEEYAALGISEFILSGYPHLEEAYWFGEGVLPILRQRGRWQHPAPGSADDAFTTTPFAPASGPAQPAAVS